MVFNIYFFLTLNIYPNQNHYFFSMTLCSACYHFCWKTKAYTCLNFYLGRYYHSVVDNRQMLSTIFFDPFQIPDRVLISDFDSLMRWPYCAKTSVHRTSLREGGAVMSSKDSIVLILYIYKYFFFIKKLVKGIWEYYLNICN